MTKRIKYFFDTEFIEDGKTIDLLSIGIVCEDGRKLYMENAQADISKASPWVKENVFPHLLMVNGGLGYTRDEIKNAVSHFVGPQKIGEKPQFWAYYADYDWVSLCQLFGTMMDLPDHWPRYCRDLKQYLDEQEVGMLPKQTTPEHHALNDAEWVRDSHKYALEYTKAVRHARVCNAVYDWIRSDIPTGMKMAMRREIVDGLLQKIMEIK
jgi:3' exoribonuclease, RNase T-like